jgi:hypothetical protein
VDGLAAPSLATGGPSDPPSLVVRPWFQSGTAVSLRAVTNAALNQHFGIQSTERFGVETDPDGDGVRNELTRGDVTALAIFQATLAVPGQVMPSDSKKARDVADGEEAFARIGCATCHVPALPLQRSGWRFTEPGPFDRLGSSQPQGRSLSIDLTDETLPQPRLSPTPGATRRRTSTTGASR